MVDPRPIAAALLVPLAALVAAAVTAVAVRRGLAHREEPNSLRGWWGRSTRSPDERRSGVNAGAVFVVVFLLSVLLLVGLLAFAPGP